MLANKTQHRDTMNTLIKKSGYNFTDAAICGASFVAVEKFYNKLELDSTVLTRGAISAGSELVSESATNMIIPYVGGLSQVSTSVEEKYLKPAMSGAIYSVSSGFLGYDNRSFMYKFLMQVGSSVGASYVSTPIKQVLNVK